MPTTTKPAVAETRLAQILTDEGRSQRWLARATGITPPTLGRIVHGKRLPDIKEAHDIARALGRDIADLGWIEAAA